MRRTAVVLLFVSMLVSVLVTVYFTYSYFTERRQLESAGLETAQSQARTATDEINTAFGDLMSITESIAEDLSDGTLVYDDIETRLRDVLTTRPDVDGLAVTFEPFAYDPDLYLFQTYVFKQEDGSLETLEGATYDYTRRATEEGDTSTVWYVDTIDEGAQWHEPFFATGAQKILIEYGTPFYPVGAGEDAEPAGIVSIDYTIDDIQALMQTLELGTTDYGFVMTGRGTFLAHPVPELVANNTVFDIVEDENLLAIARNALNGNHDIIEIDDPVSGEPTWYFFEPIESTGWTMGVVLDRSRFQPSELQTVRDQMSRAILIAGSLFLVLTFVFHIDRFQVTNFWAVSATFSILCVLLIVLAWGLTNRLKTQDGVSITNQSQLNSFIEGIDGSNDTITGLETIPTGIQVQSLQFPDPTSVTVNGYIWQRYAGDSQVTRGFALPQQIGEEATIEEVQREIVDGDEIIIWYIGVTLRQIYDTVRFPFDHRNIEIRITPMDLNANVVLTPDLDAYLVMNPQRLPGVDSLANINNWRLVSSRFSYGEQRTETNFGLPERERVLDSYELRFRIQAQRFYLGPFIAYLLPGIIAAIMTFGYLVSGRREGDNDEIVGALNYAAALFFVVAVIHTALREQIAAVNITYMEYIYILLYLAIIAVAANIFIVARFPNWAIVRYRNNLIPKALYWPVFAGVMLVVTLMIFVY